jgi:hypothetical protein
MDSHSHDNPQLQSDFAAAVADPQGFDFAFVEQRRETEFANFGYDPAKAKEMRDREIARIDAELDLEEDDDFDDDLDDEVIYDDEDDDDWEPFPDDFDDDDMDDEDEYDRYAETVSGDDWDDDEDCPV